MELGDSAYYEDVKTCSDSGFIACGYMYDDMNDGQLVQKFDSNGNLIWTRTFMSTGAFKATANSVCQTSDSGYIVVGNNSFTGNETVLLTKYSNPGPVSWATYVNPFKDNMINMECVIERSSGSFMAAGYSGNFTNGNAAGLILNFTSYGSMTSARCLDGTGNDAFTSIRELPGSGYVITGFTEEWGPGQWDIVLIKTAANGLVPGCPILESCNPSSGIPFTDVNFPFPMPTAVTEPIDDLPVYEGDYELEQMLICEEPTTTPTPTSTPSETPTDTPTPTTTPTLIPTATAVGCNVLCISSDYENSLFNTEPALVSTGLFSPLDISHWNAHE